MRGAATAAFIAGIFGTTITGGVPVVVNANGQLGVAPAAAAPAADLRSTGAESAAAGGGATSYQALAAEVARQRRELDVQATAIRGSLWLE